MLAFKATWHFHFGPASYVSDIMLSALKDTLVRVSQEKGFGNELSWTQRMMCEWGAMFLTGPGLKGQEQKLANEIASFKAPLESPVHQEVVKRLFDCFVASISKDCVMMLGARELQPLEVWILFVDL